MSQGRTSRRSFLAAGGALVGSAAIGRGARSSESLAAPSVPVAIASGNGLRAVQHARARVLEGADTALAVVDGVSIVEADPDDMSVGLGGLPDERGIVTLDASVMHGPTHKAGAVAALEDIVHASRVALKVLQNTDHVMLVGPGAREFAIMQGFRVRNLLTDRAREAWLRWKRNASDRDDWLDDDQRDWDAEGERVGSSERQGAPHTTGTIHCAAVNTRGEVSACTTTSGLSYKIPGRVGDSPIIGAGMFVDNDIGAAGATGRGEAAIQSCAAFSVVRAMEEGQDPTRACLRVLGRIADRSKSQKRLINDRGEPNFNLTLYALRKDGVYGSASMRPGRMFTVADAGRARSEACAALLD